MPRTCTICRHKQRAAIDQALVMRTPEDKELYFLVVRELESVAAGD